MTTTTPAGIARAYIDAVGAHDLASVDGLLADTLEARVGPGASNKEQWMLALARLLPALLRNDVRDVYEHGDHACVVYDFVTDTPAGAVVCVENLHVADGRITDIELVFDKVAFAPVTEALKERAAAHPAG
ncbi:nuclear transport factor 2 family protein [Humibacter ginsenosidimutans]|uniref:Nuclear transport factor 2 family protein n=1 Tax=Humibacter ginsenosidimutans TaxID=2599293 RepID=A0A5B8M6I1_9MICO|nr:nuclear transport factor 2 family protein [Humibacter ginsenosidimutans]QDZ15983.1 nuclear transport factor 2 family protein [Humibacter ginsenosidimutans]